MTTNSEPATNTNDKWDQHQGAEEGQNPPGGIRPNDKWAQTGPTQSLNGWTSSGGQWRARTPLGGFGRIGLGSNLVLLRP